MCDCDLLDRLIAAERKLQTVETLPKTMMSALTLLSETVARLIVCLDEWERTQDVIALMELHERMCGYVHSVERLVENVMSDAALLFVNARVNSFARDDESSPSAISSCGDSEQLCTNAHIAEGDPLKIRQNAMWGLFVEHFLRPNVHAERRAALLQMLIDNDPGLLEGSDIPFPPELMPETRPIRWLTRVYCDPCVNTPENEQRFHELVALHFLMRWANLESQKPSFVYFMDFVQEANAVLEDFGLHIVVTIPGACADELAEEIALFEVTLAESKGEHIDVEIVVEREGVS